MKISNLKIILLLVLGAFTLTLPNTVRAEDKLSKEMDDWFNTNLRLGTIKEGNDADLLNKIDELEKEYKKYKNEYWKLKGEFTAALAKWELKDSATGETERLAIQEAISGVKEAEGFWDTVWETAKGGWNIVTTRARRRLGSTWEYIEGFFTADKGDTAEDFLALVKKHYRADPELMSIAQKMIDVGKNAYEVYLQRQIYSENKGGKLYIYQEPGGSKIFFRQNGDTLVTVGGVTVGCIPMPAKLAESKSCIFCPLFKTIFKAAQDISTHAFTQLGKSIAMVMLIGFSIYIAFSVLKLVSSFTKQDGPKFITGLLGQAFKVLFAYVMLMNSNAVYNYAIAPVLSAGLEFGMSLLFEKGNSYISSCPTSGDANLSGIIPTYLYVKIDCFIRAVQAEISMAQTIGSSLMCVARHASADELILGIKIWDFSMMFQGLIIYCFALLISLAFAFYLIDATVRLGIVGALMPFLIACWPFKITSSYTGKGWAMFMNSFFTYVMLGLVISVNIQLMGASLTGGKGGFNAIQDALNGDRVSVLRDLLDIGFGGFLILIACCLFGFKLTGQATELANQMAGGGTSPIGSMIGGLAASGAKAVTLGVGKKGLSAAAFVGKELGEETGVTPALRRGRDKVLGYVGRALGFGKNSGVAGGSKARAAAGGAAGGASTTAQSSNKPTPPNTPPSSQAQQALGAGARNNGNNANQDNNGAADPVMNRKVQDTMKEADKNIHNYVGNKRDNDIAWDKYQKSESSLKQAKSDYENAQQMAAQAKGTPDEAQYAAAAEKAAQRYASVQKSHSQNEQNVQDTQDRMNNSAINAYVNQQKAIAQRNGKSFDENKSREYARTHLDEIKKNLDTIVKVDPRYN